MSAQGMPVLVNCRDEMITELCRQLGVKRKPGSLPGYLSKKNARACLEAVMQLRGLTN